MLMCERRSCSDLNGFVWRSQRMNGQRRREPRGVCASVGEPRGVWVAGGGRLLPRGVRITVRLDGVVMSGVLLLLWLLWLRDCLGECLLCFFLRFLRRRSPVSVGDPLDALLLLRLSDRIIAGISTESTASRPTYLTRLISTGRVVSTGL